MDSTARFLLGGVIGAALGYLLSQKSQQRAALEGAPGVIEQEVEASPVAVLAPEAPEVEPPEVEAAAEETAEIEALKALEAEAPPMAAPAEAVEAAEVVAPEAPVITSWWESEPSLVAEAPVAEPVVTEVPEAPVSESAEAPVSEAPEVEAPMWEAPEAEAAAEEPAVLLEPAAEELALEAPMLETPALEAYAPEAAEAAETAEATEAVEVVEAPESAEAVEVEAPAVESAEVEELEAAPLEAPPLEAPPFEAPLVEAPAEEETKAEWPFAESPESPSSGVTTPPPPIPWWETPAPGEVTSGEETAVVEVPVVEAEMAVGEAPVAEEEAPPAETEPPSAETPATLAEPEIEIVSQFPDEPVEAPGWTSTAPMFEEEDIESILPVVPDEFPAMEAAEIERPVAEAVPEWTEESLVAEAPVAEAVARPALDDLKARIEETRRRIRQELEQPFMAGAEVPVAPADDWTVAPAVPVEEVAISPEPEPAEISEPGPSIEGLAEAEGILEEPVDYESMKNRIESVRSRLKAKAFDAMMSGESALLGRDSEDAGHRRNVLPDVDSEVDETIESSLREEED